MNEWFNQLPYELGYSFLKNCNKIEDWGCGESKFKKYINLINFLIGTHIK